MKQEPLVSVVMPAFRCRDTISQAVVSVLIQKVPLELLIVDDASPDCLDEVLSPYLLDPRVRLLKNPRNMGAAESRNRGTDEAKGTYIAFLDADDIWHPEKLKKQLEAMKVTGAVLCASARELLRPDGTPTGRVIPVKARITYRDLLRHNAINCSSVVLKAEIAREFPLEHEDSHEDYICWMRILRKYGPACAVNEPLIKYRMGKTGKSGSKHRSAVMTFRAYRNMGFGLGKSLLLFGSYGVHGAAKYAMSYLGRKHEN